MRAINDELGGLAEGNPDNPDELVYVFLVRLEPLNNV